MTEPLYVQYGSGFCGPAKWRNFDASPTLRFERLPGIGKAYTRNQQRFPSSVEYGDICKGLPVPAGSCAGVYASHVLEHLSLRDFHKALDETFRILKPGGIFRLIVPDLHQLASKYVAESRGGDPEASMDFMRNSGLGRSTRPRTVREFVRALLGNSEHWWMWDQWSMSRALAEHGFREIRSASFGDSGDATFRLVEDAARFEGACAMQAVKPISKDEDLARNLEPR
jgi:predicted SAM-dependent methyltransferase